MAAYNAERYIASALNSLLSQSFRDFEIVVVNDGSVDNTLEIANEFVARDSRIRVVSHEHNRGLSAARNTGWLQASPLSQFIMNHDSDDVSLPRKLERLVDFLDGNPGIAAVGSFCRYINETGTALGHPPVEWTPSAIRRTFGEVNSMSISATLARRTLYEAIAPFRPEFGGCDDYDFWERALEAGFDLANIPEILHQIRIHPSSMGATQTAAMAAHAQSIAGRYNHWIGTRISSSRKSRLLSKSRAVRFRSMLWLTSIKGFF